MNLNVILNGRVSLKHESLGESSCEFSKRVNVNVQDELLNYCSKVEPLTTYILRHFISFGVYFPLWFFLSYILVTRLYTENSGRWMPRATVL